MAQRIDVHQHLIPDLYRRALAEHGIDAAGGRALPAWSAEGALELMELLQIRTAVLSISTPGVTFLDDRAAAAALARELNDRSAALRTERPDRFGFFATLPTPDIDASVSEAERALDELHADGVVLLANSRGTYLGADGQDALWAALDARAAVVFIHPAELPGPEVDGIAPFAADFLLDTTRAAYLLVRNGIVRRFPNIRFILSHAGGFVPYASHRMAVAIAGDSGRNPLENLEDFQSFYFDTALSSSPAALPTLLAFAKPGHVLFGSDWPFAPDRAGQYFVNGLEQHPLDGAARAAIDHTSAETLFPRLASTPAQTVPPSSRSNALRRELQRAAARLAFKLVQPGS